MYHGKVAVLMGGPSREREISIRSGHAIAAALKERGYKTEEFLQMDGIIDQLKKNGIEIAFLALHGNFGEDGTIQTMLEKAGVAYTGSGPEASKRAFNKKLAKEIFYQSDVSTPKWGLVNEQGKKIEIFSDGVFQEIALEQIGHHLQFPVAIKPVNEGSSIGIARIDCNRDFHHALAQVTDYSQLLIEEWIKGRELTVGILGDNALPIIEISTPRSFYDYRAKYMSGDTQYKVLKDMPESTLNKVTDHALRAYQSLGCRDMARIDLIVDAVDRIWILEVNTIPGFTNTSLLPKAAEAIGLSFSSLCEQILKMALTRLCQSV